jgi:hypothetical protein
MTEVQRAEPSPTLRSKVASTGLLVAVTTLVLGTIALIGGGFAVGLPELAVLGLVWLIVLVKTWRPRRA